MMKNPYREKILKAIQQLSHRHSTWQVFNDWLELCAISVSNSVDKSEFDKREERYLQTVAKYSKEEQAVFPEMFANLVEALQYELTWRNAPNDVLGPLFHELELHNKYKGQFFTPQHVCDMMAKMTLGDNEGAVSEKGYLSVAEPCCGSGAMVLGFAGAMNDKGLNYCTQLIVVATDIDLKCVYMTYLQLALYGIPAVVIHGNTITLEEWSRWYTPVYILNGWRCKAGYVSNLDKLGVQLPKDETADKPVQLSLFEEVSGIG